MALKSIHGWVPIVGADMKRVESLEKIRDKMGLIDKLFRFKLDGEIG